LHFPPARSCAPGPSFAGADSAVITAGFELSQQLFRCFEGAEASQQLLSFANFAVVSQQLWRTFGGEIAGSGFGSGFDEQQHPRVAFSRAEQEQVIPAQGVVWPECVSLATVATGNATAGVNWPRSARTARAVRR
jgi:hypothetical protein